LNYINNQQYSSLVLSNQLRVVYLHSVSTISYCGFVINAGARDERMDQFGLAHFVEHMLFKGSKKNNSKHVIKHIGNIGGELNAFTTKEETFLYSICLSEDTEKAIKLLSNLIFCPLFPSIEIEKEKEIIKDEIDLCESIPSELIFDEFENILFQKSELGHNILGRKCNMDKFTSQSCYEFFNTFYNPKNMIFFFTAKHHLQKFFI
jgi:predicted Zn-dependent peptidase